ncbi:hypothetical protein K466DRAFT_281133 [Polyporus arcularius HHB13444]|uniref:Uncharacterized protein n=1 Tax=Polyporus arcularius HHB13444 TaxID=1314778 RepID=A0A5C3NZT0_9APHY|nr:hypothetical protein K466DRAFT_281133 [Polyporus arcularius HHB13444]
MTIGRAGFARINTAGKVSVTSRRTLDTRQRTLETGQQTADSGQTSHVPRPTRSRPAKFVTGPCNCRRQSWMAGCRVCGASTPRLVWSRLDRYKVYGLWDVGYGIWDGARNLCRPHSSHSSQCARHTFMPQSQSQSQSKSMSKSMRCLELWLWLWSAPDACNEPHPDCHTAATGYQAPGYQAPGSRRPSTSGRCTVRGGRGMPDGDGRRRL